MKSELDKRATHVALKYQTVTLPTQTWATELELDPALVEGCETPVAWRILKEHLAAQGVEV